MRECDTVIDELEHAERRDAFQTRHSTEKQRRFVYCELNDTIRHVSKMFVYSASFGARFM